MSAGTFVRVEGRGPPLVLIHGVGLDHTMWDEVSDRLAATRQVIRFDLLGHGNSPDPEGTRIIEDFVDQLVDVIAGCGLDGCDVAGISLGAMIALATAANRPDRVRRLALLNAVFERSPEEIAAVDHRLDVTRTSGLAAVADLAIDRWFPPLWQAEHPDRVDAIRRRIATNDDNAYLKAYRLFATGDPNLRRTAASVTAETLVMTGELDPSSTPAMSHALANALPNGQAHILPNLHHLPPIEAPDVFTRALRDFLDEERAEP